MVQVGTRTQKGWNWKDIVYKASHLGLNGPTIYTELSGKKNKPYRLWICEIKL